MNQMDYMAYKNTCDFCEGRRYHTCTGYDCREAVKKEETYKGKYQKNMNTCKLQEPRWCRTCAKSNNCQIKERVAEEQRMILPYPVKYLEVTIKCKYYIKNGKLPPDSDGMIKSLFVK